MRTEDFDMLSEEQIDFSSLDVDTLKLLVLESNDYFIKTSALSDLKIKDGSSALTQAKNIWNKGLGDKFLLAQSLTIILQLDRNSGIKILDHIIDDCDSYILNAVANYIVDEIESFSSEESFQTLKIKFDKRIKNGDLANYNDDNYLSEQWEKICNQE